MRRPEYRRAQTRHRILYWHGSWRVLTEKSVLRNRTQSTTAVATMWNSAAAPQKLKTELPYDSAIPLLRIHTDELETRTQVFHTPHDSQQTKGENNPSVHPGTKGKNNMWSAHARNESWSRYTWKAFEGVTLSGETDTRRRAPQNPTSTRHAGQPGSQRGVDGGCQGRGGRWRSWVSKGDSLGLGVGRVLEVDGGDERTRVWMFLPLNCTLQYG